MRRLFAVLFTAAPFVAGVVAALSARHDVRMLWMALVVTVVVRLVVMAAPVRWGSGRTVGLAFAAATGAAVGVALLFGARAIFGIAAVAIVLAS